MTQSAEQMPSKPKRVMTQEHKDKMRAGREAALRERKFSQKEGSDGLTRTTSAEIKEKQKQRSLDAIAQRHIEKNQDDELDDELPADEEEEGEGAPTPEEVASRTELFNDAGEQYTADDELPADEPLPRDRDAATVGRIEKLRDDSDDELRTLADLMAEYGQAIESGHAYIHVDRKHPLVIDHTRIKGVQRPIRQTMTQEEFNQFYGYGKYELIVYGPSQRGGFKYDPSTGQPVYRKLTRPVVIDVPAGYPANPAAMFQDEQEYEEEMHSAARIQGRDRFLRTGATNADAEMHKTELTFDEKKQERQLALEKEREQELKQREREQQRQTNTLLEQLAQAHERQMDLAKEAFDRQLEQQQQFAAQQLAQQQREIDALRSEMKNPRRSESEVLVSALGQVMPALQRQDMTAEQRLELDRAMTADKERMEQRHREEVSRLQDQLRAADDRARTAGDEERRRADTRVDEERRRCEDRVREAVEQCNTRVRDLEERTRQQIEEARRDCDRRLADLKSHYDSRIQDIDRGHQTELRTREDNFTTRFEALKSTQQSQLELKDKELERVCGELAEAKKEAKRPLADRLREQEETAEAMGWVKADEVEQKDWKAMIPEVGLQILQNVPALLETVKHTVDARQRTALMQQQQRAIGAGPMVQQGSAPSLVQAPLPFATEDGVQFSFDSGHDAPPPIYPNAQQQPGPSRRPVPNPRQSAPPTPPPEALAPFDSMVPPPPAPMQQPLAPMQPAQPTQQPNNQQPMAQQFSVTDDQIVQYSAMLNAAFQQGVQPQQFVNDLLQEVGPQMVQVVGSAIDPERVITVLGEREPENALLRRDGQKFLRDIWAIIQPKK